MSLVAKLLGRCSRWLPQGENDNDPMQVRLWRYGEMPTVGMIRKQSALAEEGTYFVTNNAQTGIATPAVATFTAVSPLLQIFNSDSPLNSSAKNITLDYINLTTTAAGGWASAGVNEQIHLYVDSGDRYTSGGTDLSPLIVNPNMAAPVRASVAKVRFGALTIPAATGSVRAVCGLRIARPAVSATVADVIGETKQLNFGGVEAMLNGAITVASANMISIPLPPIVIPPGMCAILYFTLNGTTPSAASFAPELGWWER